MCVDRIDVDEPNAHISFCNAGNEGVKQIKSLNPYIRQQAATAAATEGISFEEGSEIGNMIAVAASPFVKNGNSPFSVIVVRGVDFGKHAKRFMARLYGKGTLTAHLDSVDSPAIATLTTTTDEWKDLRTKVNAMGVHEIYFRLTSNLKFDYWQFK